MYTDFAELNFFPHVMHVIILAMKLLIQWYTDSLVLKKKCLLGNCVVTIDQRLYNQ